VSCRSARKRGTERELLTAVVHYTSAVSPCTKAAYILWTHFICLQMQARDLGGPGAVEALRAARDRNRVVRAARLIGPATAGSALPTLAIRASDSPLLLKPRVTLPDLGWAVVVRAGAGVEAVGRARKLDRRVWAIRNTPVPIDIVRECAVDQDRRRAVRGFADAYALSTTGENS
jgi:hypothetical protein